jgi:hypothetical protein
MSLGKTLGRRKIEATFMAHLDAKGQAAATRRQPPDKLVLFNVPLDYPLDELKRTLHARSACVRLCVYLLIVCSS